MASTSNSSTMNHHSPPFASGPSSPNTTFVQADPSTFRTIVQKLTGAPDDPSAQKLPLTLPSRATVNARPDNIGPKKPTFKLHERRQSGKNLEIMLNNSGSNPAECSNVSFFRQRGFLVSPVSPLDFLTRPSPRSPREELHTRGSPRSPQEEEDRVIAEKGFYLHRSPLSTPRGNEPPELLPLFPLRSPRQTDDSHDCNSSST